MIPYMTFRYDIQSSFNVTGGLRCPTKNEKGKMEERITDSATITDCHVIPCYARVVLKSTVGALLSDKCPRRLWTDVGTNGRGQAGRAVEKFGVVLSVKNLFARLVHVNATGSGRVAACGRGRSRIGGACMVVRDQCVW